MSDAHVVAVVVGEEEAAEVKVYEFSGPEEAQKFYHDVERIATVVEEPFILVYAPEPVTRFGDSLQAWEDFRGWIDLPDDPCAECGHSAADHGGGPGEGEYPDQPCGECDCERGLKRMGDYSYLTLIVYALPLGTPEVDILVAINEDWGLTCEETDDPNSAVIGRWTAEEASLDAYESIGKRLRKIEPNLTFEIWNDPKYEYLGGLFMNAPELGSWTGQCDSDGSPVFTAHEVEKILREPPDRQAKLFGLPWLDLFRISTSTVSRCLMAIQLRVTRPGSVLSLLIDREISELQLKAVEIVDGSTSQQYMVSLIQRSAETQQHPARDARR